MTKRQATAITKRLARAILGREVFAVRFTLTREPSLKDLTWIERQLDRWVHAVMVDMGFKLPRGFRFVCPVGEMVHRNDGEHWVEVEMDFGRIIAEDKSA